MKTAARIQRFILDIKQNEMFTTRQLLSFGPRNQIDQTTHKLVKQGVLIRVAYGVFLLAGSDLSLLTAEKVANVKGPAFNREIVEHATDAGSKLGINGPSNPGPTFSTRARSSSFLERITHTRIYFKGVSARKFKLAGTFTGDLLRALWNLTENGLTDAALDTASITMQASHRAELPGFAALIPEWLHECFAFAWA